MSNYENEISRIPPAAASAFDFGDGNPILYAYGCALLEIDLGEYFIYKAGSFHKLPKISQSL